ncbi:MAG: winged helix-turn-helix domain-containing protein [Myxococcota bacterium]
MKRIGRFVDVVQLVDRNVDLTRRRVWCGDVATPLTDQEAGLLAYLVARPGQVVPRDELLVRVWGYSESVVTRAVDAAVRRLRNKIEADPSDPVHLLTVHGVGFRWQPLPSDDAEDIVVVVDWGDALATSERSRVEVVQDVHLALDDARQRHGGRGLTQGPETSVAAFEMPLPAARFTLTVQRDLEKYVWPKVGTARGTDARARASRLCAAAWPGQILVDPQLAQDFGAIEDLGAIAAPRQAADLGIEGLSTVVELTAVEHAQRRFPSRGGTPLPAVHDEFVGRQAAFRLLDEATKAAGWVTVAGPAGVGKSRLTLEFARRWTAGRAWICKVGTALRFDEVVHIVADALGVPLRSRDQATACHAIGRALAGRGTGLVVLDGMDRFVPEGAATLRLWRSLAPSMTFVITSRRRLDVPDETVVEVPPLDVDDAVALFEARVSVPRFEPTAVEALVIRVDRLPLAIELAAARTEILSPSELLKHLTSSIEARFRTLRSPSGEMGLWGALDASWQLLDAMEREALACCAGFRGAFDLAAATAVLGDLDPLTTSDRLHELKARSLVRAFRTDRGGIRFSLLDSVRDHAWAQLEEEGRTQVLERHCAHYATLGGPAALAHQFGREGAVWLAERTADLPDLTAALEHAVSVKDGARSVALGLVITDVVRRTGPYSMALEAMEPIWAVVNDDADRSRLRLAQSQLLDGMGDGQAGAFATEAVALAEASGQASCIAASLLQLGRVQAHRAEEAKAFEHFQAARAAARRAGDLRLQAQAIGGLANLHSRRGERSAAHERYHQAEVLFRQLGDVRGQALIAANLAAEAADTGDLEAARRGYAEAMACFGAVGERGLVAHLGCNLGNALTALGRLPEAERVLHDALEVHRDLGDGRGQGRAWLLLAELHLDRGRPKAASEPLERAMERLREAGDHRNLALAQVARGCSWIDRGAPETARPHLEAGLATLRRIGDPRGIAYGLVQWARVTESLDEAQRSLDEARSLATAADDGLLGALVVCERGLLAVRQGRLDRAREALAHASEVQASLKLTPASLLGRRCAMLRSALAE